MVRQNRTIIQRMDKEATVDIETEKLKYLCDIAEKYHGASENIRRWWWRLWYYNYQ